jgi:hypothetical protein
VPANHKKDRRKPGIRPITTARGKHPRKEMMVSCITLRILWHCNIINSRAKNYLVERLESIYNRSIHACQVTTTREEFFFMSDVPALVEHLKKLAQDYHDTHHSLETRYREMESAEEFLVELRQQESELLNRFRLVQNQLLASLDEEKLEEAVELCRIFDQVRIINQFVIQALVAKESETEVD